MSSSLAARSCVSLAIQVCDACASGAARFFLTDVPTGTVEFGVITSFAYKLEDNSGEIVVATTRCVILALVCTRCVLTHGMH